MALWDDPEDSMCICDQSINWFECMTGSKPEKPTEPKEKPTEPKEKPTEKPTETKETKETKEKPTEPKEKPTETKETKETKEKPKQCCPSWKKKVLMRAENHYARTTLCNVEHRECCFQSQPDCHWLMYGKVGSPDSVQLTDAVSLRHIQNCPKSHDNTGLFCPSDCVFRKRGACFRQHLSQKETTAYCLLAAGILGKNERCTLDRSLSATMLKALSRSTSTPVDIIHALLGLNY